MHRNALEWIIKCSASELKRTARQCMLASQNVCKPCSVNGAEFQLLVSHCSGASAEPVRTAWLISREEHVHDSHEEVSSAVYGSLH